LARRVLSQRGGAVGTTDELIIDVSFLKAGNYVLRVGGRVATIVKQ